MAQKRPARKTPRKAKAKAKATAKSPAARAKASAKKKPLARPRAAPARRGAKPAKPPRKAAKRPAAPRRPAKKRPQAPGIAALERWTDLELDSAAVARQACELIRDFEPHPEKYTNPEGITSPFHHIVGLFQQPVVQEAKDTLRAEALPVLVRLYDTRLAEWRKTGSREGYDPLAGDLLFALKIFAMYGGEEAIQRIIDAARVPIDSHGYMWSVIFSALADHDPKAAAHVATTLRDPLPPAFIAVTLLDMANTLAREHGLTPHPFDTPQGRELIRALLTDKNPDNFSYAHSATASLSFLPGSRELLAIAVEHPDLNVRMEAAWGAARAGDAQALARLQEWSKHSKTRSRAVSYLKELGSQPTQVQEEVPGQLDAMAEMSQWLEHPSEFGQAPDHLELADHRRLFWPPTNDERDVWLFRYRYEGDSPEEGVGMVGSVTFALFGETTATLPPEDVYALHCCWELEQLGDKRAPKKRTAQAGRKLLGFPAR